MRTTVKLRLSGMPTVLSSLLELYFIIIFFIYVFIEDFDCITTTDIFMYILF